MKKFLVVFSLVILSCAIANASVLDFDPLGGGSFTGITALGLESNAEYADNPTGVLVAQDLWSYEDASGDFTEQFTLQVTNADLALGGQWDLKPLSLYVDVYLEGNIDIANALATFSYGTAKIYKDNDGNSGTPGATDNFDAGTDDDIADFELMAPGFMTLSGTVLDEGISGEVDLVFNFTETYVDYWGQDVDDLVDVGWIMSFMAGRITAADVVGPDTAGNIIVGWDSTDIDAEFNVVPEPSTLLLLGFGLVGIAAAGRKRFAKKN